VGLQRSGYLAWRGIRAVGLRVLPEPFADRVRAWRQARHRARKERERRRQRGEREASKNRERIAAQATSGAGRPRLERTERERLYWSVNSIFQAVLGEGRVRVSMPPDDAHTLAIHDAVTKSHARLALAPRDERVLAGIEAADGTAHLGEFETRQAAAYAVLRAFLQREKLIASAGSRAAPCRIWVPMVEGRLVPRLLRVGPQWTSALHRSGWGGAMETVASLHDDHGVLFDGFLEATFCWKDTGQVHRRPWVGVCHNPPETPAWIGTTNDDLFANERFRRSLRHCKGLFVLSEYHRRELAKRIDIPISVISLPSDAPPLTFSVGAFEQNPRPRLVQVGHWLRNPNTLYQLRVQRLIKTRLDVGHPWEEAVRKHLPPAEPLDLDSVEVLPRLPDEDYDELLSRNIVFLDLIDSSANNAIVECIVRETPVLVKRLPAVVEYLGPEYPFYFEDLEQAARKAENRELVRRTHRYLRELPKERFSREGFLHGLVGSRVYRALEPARREKLFAFGAGGSVSPVLRILQCHPELRILEQPFHANRAKWDDESHHSYVEGARGGDALDRCLDEILHYHTGLAHVLGQLPEHLERRLLARSGRRLVVRRRSRLRAAVLALLDEEAAHPPSAATPRGLRDPVDEQAVAERLRRDADRLERTVSYLRERGHAYQEIFVEDLLAPGSWNDQEERARELFRSLGVSEPDVRTWERVSATAGELESMEAARLADVLNAPEIERRFGGDDVGRLGAAVAVQSHPAAGQRRTSRPSTLPFRSPDAQVLLLHATHHKAGTHWILHVLRGIAKRYQLHLAQVDAPLEAAYPDILVDPHSRTDLSKLPRHRGSHMVRDPRDMVVSGYFYHLWTEETWVHKPDERYGGRSYQQYLNAVDREEGLLEEIHRCAFTFEAMAQWNYDNPSIFEVRYEDLMQEGERGFERLFEHYGFAPEAIDLGLEVARASSFEARSKREPGQIEERSVLRSGKPGQWREHFTRRVKERFREATGDLLVQLGYESGPDW
jgi:hypothetical protein